MIYGQIQEMAHPHTTCIFKFTVIYLNSYQSLFSSSFDCMDKHLRLRQLKITEDLHLWTDLKYDLVFILHLIPGNTQTQRKSLPYHFHKLMS